MSSTISAAWNQLYTLFAAQTGTGGTLEGVQVTAGPPSAYEDQEVVAVLGWGDPEETSAVVGGAKPREERYQIEVAVKAEDPAGTSISVMQRLLTIADAVRDIVRTNERLVSSPTDVICHVVRRRSDGPRVPQTPEGAPSSGWVCFDLISVECWAPRVS